MKTPKLFLDSCDPEMTKQAVSLLGSLDGQTTNPTLLVKNPEVQKYLGGNKRIKEADLLKIYREAVEAISRLTDGAVSVEVYADWHTTAEEMLSQAQEMFGWGPHIYMKFPTIPEGLKAAHEFTSRGGRVNMTLVFDQMQAAAVYSATLNAKAPAFVSPFVGRWDDRGYQGVDLIRHIVRMYRAFDGHRGIDRGRVEVLAASIRTMDHFYASIAYGADIITAPYATFQKWVDEGKKVPDSYQVTTTTLKQIDYREVTYTEEFGTYHIDQTPDGLLNQGLEKFVQDWNNVVEK